MTFTLHHPSHSTAGDVTLGWWISMIAIRRHLRITLVNSPMMIQHHVWPSTVHGVPTNRSIVVHKVGHTLHAYYEYIHTCIHACMHMACLPAARSWCIRSAILHTYPIYMHAYMYPCMRACLHAYTHACVCVHPRHARMPMYIHAGMHACIHKVPTTERLAGADTWAEMARRVQGPFEPWAARVCDTCEAMGWISWQGSPIASWRCCGERNIKRSRRVKRAAL